MVEKISAVTLRVANMEASVRFYKDVLGLEIIYAAFSLLPSSYPATVPLHSADQQFSFVNHFFRQALM